jgi:hypothetical protein
MIVARPLVETVYAIAAVFVSQESLMGTVVACGNCGLGWFDRIMWQERLTG